MELPPHFLETEWPFAAELDALRRVQSLRAAVDAKLQSLALDFRAHRMYARRIELRALQLRVHHTFTPPVVAATSDDSDAPTLGSPGRWTLQLQAIDPATNSPVNLVHYFRKVSIELDPRLYSDALVEWTCFQKGNHDVHTLEVARAGHTPHSVRIKLQPSHTIERYVLSDTLRTALAAFMHDTNAQSFTKQDVLVAVWEYIKRKNLIKEDDCRVAVCDAVLRQLFQCDTLPFTSIVVALKPHLTPAPPLDIEYHLSLERPEGEKEDEMAPLDEKVVVVDVGHVDEVERAREVALQAWDELQQEQQKELALLQRQETQLLSTLQACHRKVEWMQQFALDPAGFIADVAASQENDMEILTSEAETDEINVPHANQFTQPWVREVVSDLLIPPPAN